MTGKNCRHIPQAFQLSTLRKAFKQKENLCCETCHGGATSSNSSKSKGASKSKHKDTGAGSTSGKNDATDDLSLCITCGWIGCHTEHTKDHFQSNPKHFALFQITSKTFYCFPCQSEIESDVNPKIQKVHKECDQAFEEIMSKQLKRMKGRVKPTASAAATSLLDTSTTITATTKVSASVKEKEKEQVPVVKEEDTKIKGKNKSSHKKRQEEFSEEEEDTEEDTEEATTPIDPNRPFPVVGFTNTGNTCYFNSSVQALLCSMNYFPHILKENELYNVSSLPLVHTLLLLNSSIKKTNPNKKKAKKNAKIMNPTLLLKEIRQKFPQFRGNYQQDAHELLVSLLWGVEDEIEENTFKEKEKQQEDKTTTTTTTTTTMKNSKKQLQQIFVKTEAGETMSLQVSSDMPVEELEKMLAEKLQMDPKMMMLQHNGRVINNTTTAENSIEVPKPKTRSVFSELNFARHLFGGGLLSIVTCNHCGHLSETREDAFQLSLPIPIANYRNNHLMTLDDCLYTFTQETLLSTRNENGYDCDKCSRTTTTTSSGNKTEKDGSEEDDDSEADEDDEPELRDACMEVSLSKTKLPKIFVVHLKRLCRGKKISQHVQFRTQLDIRRYLEDKEESSDEEFSDSEEESESDSDDEDQDGLLTKYDLISVIVHSGNKRSGHYYAYVSREISDPQDSKAKLKQWYYVSDTEVKLVSIKEVLKAEAYMLFYKQLEPEQKEKEDQDKEDKKDKEEEEEDEEEDIIDDDDL